MMTTFTVLVCCKRSNRKPFDASQQSQFFHELLRLSELAGQLIDGAESRVSSLERDYELSVTETSRQSLAIPHDSICRADAPNANLRHLRHEFQRSTGHGGPGWILVRHRFHAGHRPANRHLPVLARVVRIGSNLNPNRLSLRKRPWRRPRKRGEAFAGPAVQSTSTPNIAPLRFEEARCLVDTIRPNAHGQQTGNEQC